MMRIRLIIAAALFAAPALAADVDCKNAVTQMDMNICANDVYQAADKKLNKLYGALVAQYDAKTQALLKDAERKWIAYRDSECTFETAQSEGGSIRPMEYSICLTNKTNAHIKELQDQANCAEGDPTCNKP